MPELPEVEILSRHLAPLLKNVRVRDISVFRPRALRPTTKRRMRGTLQGARIVDVHRRGKFLLFGLETSRTREPVQLLAHLGMTGRVYVRPRSQPLPKHGVLALDLGKRRFVFEDMRGFGRFTLDTSPLRTLGPEPLSKDFSKSYLESALRGSRQPIKPRLLDQSLVAGLGNIYASEALYSAGIDPRSLSRDLTKPWIERLHHGIRMVLRKAIRLGSSLSLDWSGEASTNHVFYYGQPEEDVAGVEESFEVYDREGKACRRCGILVLRFVQAGRSTFYCPGCQMRARAHLRNFG